jgi:hypothetical protein
MDAKYEKCMCVRNILDRGWYLEMELSGWVIT